MRAAEGHGCRRHPERVFPALQGHRARRPAAPVPGGRRRPVRAGRCCRRWTRAPRDGVRLRGRAAGGDDAQRRVRGQDHVEPHRRSVGAARRADASRTSSGRCATCRSIRRDKVAQAVSLWTAIQTQAWRSGDDVQREPVYSFAAIKHLVGWLAGGRARLDGVAAPAATRTSSSTRTSCATRRRRSQTLAGVPAPPAPLRRQSGSRSDEWASRFVAGGRMNALEDEAVFVMREVAAEFERPGAAVQRRQGLDRAAAAGREGVPAGARSRARSCTSTPATTSPRCSSSATGGWRSWASS